MNGEHLNTKEAPTTEQHFKVKAEIRYSVDVGIFLATSAEEAKKLAQEGPHYSRIVDRHHGGVYDLEARPVEQGHQRYCGCGWCK